MIPSKGDLNASRWAQPGPRLHSKQPTFSPSLPSLTPQISPPNRSHSTSPSRQPAATTTTPTPSYHYHVPSKPLPNNPALHQPPATTTTTTPSPLLTTRIQHLTLLSRLLPRLKWRASLLLTSHTFATNPSQHGIGLSEAEADMQFRVDFFEFYVLLERVLVALLATVGVRVSRFHEPAAAAGSANGAEVAPGGHGMRHTSTITTAMDGNERSTASNGIIGERIVKSFHAFHANLLSALAQREHNPLYDVLGTGQVHAYIALAKDLRNGWKESASEDSTATPTLQGHGKGVASNAQQGKINNPEGGQMPNDEEVLQQRLKRRYAELLRELKLDEMLRVVLLAVEQAVGVARGEVERAVAAEAEAGRRRDGQGHGRDGIGDGHIRKTSVEMMDVMFEDVHGGQNGEDGPVESFGMGMAEWGVDEMEFD